MFEFNIYVTNKAIISHYVAFLTIPQHPSSYSPVSEWKSSLQQQQRQQRPATKLLVTGDVWIIFIFVFSFKKNPILYFLSLLIQSSVGCVNQERLIKYFYTLPIYKTNKIIVTVPFRCQEKNNIHTFGQIALSGWF